MGDPLGDQLGKLGKPLGDTVVYLNCLEQPVARRSQLPTPNRMTVWIDFNKCKGKQASLYKKTCINFYSLGCGGCVFDFSGGFKLYTLG